MRVTWLELAPGSEHLQTVRVIARPLPRHPNGQIPLVLGPVDLTASAHAVNQTSSAGHAEALAAHRHLQTFAAIFKKIPPPGRAGPADDSAGEHPE
jgi:hypothetical protein